MFQITNFPSFWWKDDLYNKVDAKGRTRLIVAAAVGDIALIDMFVKHGANPHHVDADGWDALFHAVNACQPNAVRHLIVVHGLNPNARDKLGRTPIMIAAARGDISTIETLIQCGADPYETDYDGWDVLMYASGYGHIHAVAHFIKRYGMDTNRSDRHGLTSVIIASAKGYGHIIDFLFENGADITHADCQLRTALHHALISLDSIKSKTKFLPTLDNLSGSFFSLLSNYTGPGVDVVIHIIRRLISRYKLDPNRSDLHGNTPLMYAVIWRANTSDIKSYTPLYYAILQNTMSSFNSVDQVIKTLIDLGANPFISNSKGENAFILAKRLGFELKVSSQAISKIKL